MNKDINQVLADDYNCCVKDLKKLDKKYNKLKLKNENNQKKLDVIKFYIEQSNIKDMLWGKEILEIIGGNYDGKRDV